MIERYVRQRIHARRTPYDQRRMTIARILSFLIIIVGVLDAVSTNAGLKVGGYEMNPVIRFIMLHIGEMWVAPKLLVHVWLAFMVLWFPNKATLLLMMFAMFLTLIAVFGNLSIAFNIS